eukprot:scaffold92520_cov61-Phaeocystis_antarctica.AAC.1
MWCCGDDEAGCMASASNAVVAARVVTEGVEGKFNAITADPATGTHSSERLFVRPAKDESGDAAPLSEATADLS